MAKALLLLFSLFIIFFFSISSFTHPSSQTLSIAIKTLSNSHYLSMALILQLISQSHITPNFCNVTIFAPSDTAFSKSGLPSVLLLQYHISPFRFSIEEFRAFPYGSKIPTLLSERTLVVTSNCGGLQINNVKINESVVFDDGSVAIYGMDQFFNSSFVQSPNLAPNPSCPNSSPIANVPSGVDVDHLTMPLDSVTKASDMLRSEGYLKMATFLDLQLLGFKDETKLTIFAPIDGLINEYVKKSFSDYNLVFRRHVVPKLLTWNDLANLDGVDTVLQTFSGNFMINVEMSGDVVVLNDVPVIFPDMYKSDSIVVHGISQLLFPFAVKKETMGDSFSEFGGQDDGNSTDYRDY